MTTAVTRQDLSIPWITKKDPLVFVLHDVLSPQECAHFIKLTEDKGYEAALLNMGGGREQLVTDVRNSDRCIIDSFEEADKIWQRIKQFVPERWNEWQVVGLNERLRFLRYEPGQYFKPHFDGRYARENGECSFITVQLYLNEGFKGGNTTFLSTNNDSQMVEVVPKTGSALIFEHQLLHEGSILLKGRKYAVRTDVMYIRK